ncbi:PREDICTED: SCY1-like protein 2 [Dinoponera quadriceps]|uniref:SCY1-like protein 2 n=1 Tax=Dinoponera quadriceps TaxID=609295 RepID=A0A6P3WP38_DINQU|nr:PREDICTED: SCY1-like protein 2 [Dinoponera quadriceps]
MDVLNKLRNTVSNTISNTVQNTAYGLSQLSSVLPGNPVTREFEATAHVASAGPGLLWKVYSGYKKSTKQEAAIFVFEKRMLERWSAKADRELVLETLKRGVTQLTKLRHPQVLTVQHPLEESRDSLAFATEPVFASLANVLGNHENIPQPTPANLRDYKLHDIEIRYGLLQLGEGLAFLHGDVKLLHRNLCPESIVINVHGAWKIFGFDFCALNQSSDSKQPSWSYLEYDPTLPPVVQPHLNYQAPECILASSNGPPSDIFALGMLIYVIHSSEHQTLYESHGDLGKCRRFLESLKGSNVSAKLLPVPETLRDTVKLMLSHSPELRLDAHQFIKIEYFTDIGVKTLNYLDKLFQWDNLQKSQFYKGLPQLLKQLPHRVVLHRVLPALYKELVNPPMIPFVLPSILQVMEVTEVEEFREHILPSLKPVLALEDPPQISLVLMQQVNLLLKLCPTDVIKTDIVPMLLRALESEWEQLQELCLSALPNIVTMIEGPVIKNAILPRMKKICLSPGKKTSSLGVRVSCLLCLAKMLPSFDRWLVFDQILPFLQEVPHSGEPAILMAIIGIYRMLLTHSKLGMSKEILATKVLPFLLPLCIEQNLSMPQYETLSSLVVDMINRVTSEHREALRQLDAVRRETQQFDQALSQATSPAFMQNTSLSDINLTPEKPSANANLKTVNIENGLTMEDKFRLIQQQEAHQRLQSQSILTPKAVSQPAKPQPKDLTATLLKNNLDELNLSMSRPSMSQPDYTAKNTAALSWNKNNNINQTQTQFLTSPTLSSQTMQTGRPMNWNSNGINAPMSWNADQSASMWNPVAPQNNVVYSQWEGQAKFATQPEIKPSLNFPGSMQPFMSPGSTQAANKPNSSTQDIMDLLS